MGSSRARRALSFAFLLSAVTASAHAVADAQVRLRYERTPLAAGCPDEAGMRDAVAARLGYDPFVGDAAPRVAISLDRRGGEWQARIELEDAAQVRKGSRVLGSRERTCDELVSAVSLAVALAIDPMRLSPAAPKEPPPTPKEPPPPAPTPAAETPKEPPGPEPPRPEPPGPRAAGFASAGAFVIAGIVPGASFGPRLRAGIGWRRLSVALEGIYVAPSAEDSSSGRVEASVLAGGVLPCLKVEPSVVVVEICARALFGALFGEASRVGVSNPSTDPHASAGAEIGVELPLSPAWGVRAHAGALATLTRTFLRIRDAGREVDVWSTPAFSGGGGAELVVHFP